MTEKIVQPIRTHFGVAAWRKSVESAIFPVEYRSLSRVAVDSGDLENGVGMVFLLFSSCSSLVSPTTMVKEEEELQPTTLWKMSLFTMVLHKKIRNR